MEMRFELYPNLSTNQYDIKDNKESIEKKAMVIYNDLGSVYFSSAPAMCELLNDLEKEKEDYKDQLILANAFIKCIENNYEDMSIEDIILYNCGNDDEKYRKEFDLQYAIAREEML